MRFFERNIAVLAVVLVILGGSGTSLADQHFVSAIEDLSNVHPLEGKKVSLVDCPPTAEKKQESRPKVLLDFMGKGPAVARDMGVIKALYSETELLKGPDLQFAGNSSGSILAAYFACWGISAQTIEEANKMLLEFDYGLIPTDSKLKTKQLLVGASPEYPHENITPLIERVLTRNGKKCDPKAPLLIPATNGDVLDNRVMVERSGRLIAKLKESLDLKRVNLDNYEVHLNGKLLGKACTYFVTAAMYEKLSKIPYANRLCELRMIENYEDLFLAVKASVSEPTYFPEVPETEEGKIAGRKIKDSAVADHSNRTYIGGFLNQTLAEDLKKVDPSVYAITTGMEELGNAPNGLLRRWYMMSTNEATERGRKFVDLEFEAPNLWDRMGNEMSAEAWVQEGASLARGQIRRMRSHCLLR